VVLNNIAQFRYFCNTILSYLNWNEAGETKRRDDRKEALEKAGQDGR